MKKWNQPMTIVEDFMPNEYCSSCGEEPVYEGFQCNAGGGAYGAIYVLNDDGTYTIESNSPSSFHACTETHETGVRDVYKEGIFDPDTNHSNGNEVKCLIWYKKRYYTFTKYYLEYQGHATTNFNTSSWEPTKS